MTNFGWWAEQVPDGYFLCCICFAAWMLEFALIEDGERVDICWACGVEERVLAARAAQGKVCRECRRPMPGHHKFDCSEGRWEKQPGPKDGPSEAEGKR